VGVDVPIDAWADGKMSGNLWKIRPPVGAVALNRLWRGKAVEDNSPYLFANLLGGRRAGSAHLIRTAATAIPPFSLPLPIVVLPRTPASRFAGFSLRFTSLA
jgi:hypothetical protein